MTSKFWLCGLLTVAVLVCGCGEKTGTTKVETKPVKAERNIVKLETSMGDIVVELNAQAAPVTVKNFLRYVNEGFYDGTIFHRVIHGFMIQGGGLTADMTKKQTHDPIPNEGANGLKNVRGAIAMARGEDPDSATSQFFINHVENEGLDYIPNVEPGYAVFGKVTEGMDVVDTIARVDTTTREGRANVPVEPIVLKSARVVSQ
ncbi:MAG: peptidylprolyl isomerase [Planctomycetota bacterium]|jgi:peptidyl-prolyl cis-trans isomerase A (cyclophilin A)